MAKVLNHNTDHRGWFDLNGKELRNPVAQNLGSDPGSPVEGQFFWRSDTKKWRVYNGTAWEDMGAGGGGSGIPETLIDAKGDLIVGLSDDTAGRKAIGADGTIFFADSADTTGVTWRTLLDGDIPAAIMRDAEHDLAHHQELIATNDLTDWPRSAALSLNNQKITSLADGTATTDAINLGQLQGAIEGRGWKDPVRVATTAAGTLASSFENGDTIDGVVLATGDRILVKNQAAPAENGIYVVAASGAPTRAADASTVAEVNDATVLVEAGTVGAGDVFTQTAVVATLGTDALTWTKTGEGNTLYGADGTSIELTGTTFSVKDAGVTAAKLAGSVAGNGITGGAGAALAVDPAVVVRKASGALTGGATSEVLTHNLNTRDVSVVIRNNAAPYEEVMVESEATSVNTVTIRAVANLPAGYRWLVVG